jgi:glycosyltransferase involved in cell wall biosynthesis
MDYPKTLIILPALNEAKNISKAVTNIREHVSWADILVINDGSTDQTTNEAQDAGAIVFNMPYNVGIGAAVQTGFKYAARNNYEFVARLDGDGQHNPDDTVRLLEIVQSGEYDVAIGSRFLGDGDYGTSFMRKLGITIISGLLRLITKRRVTDPTSGFSAFNRRAIMLFAKLYPHDYPEPEAIVICHKSGLQVCEIPVTFLIREHGVSQFTVPTRSAYYMLKVTLAILINTLRPVPTADGS